MTVLSRSRSRAAMNQAIPASMIDPLRVHEMVHTPEFMPDPIEWCVSDKYLNRPNLYPRQATMLKVIFLRDDMLTQYDFDVIGEWEDTFNRVGNEGISPQILERIQINKAAGRPWFREVLTVLGRRGSKGHIGGVCGSFVLWYYMHRPGGPQSYYGIDRDKRLTAIVFAGKKEQATANQWRDLNNMILGGPCFTPYISRPQGERLTVFAPSDFLRIQRQMSSGVATESDQATFEIIPSSSTLMAGRGPTSFMHFYDEMAHLVATGSNRAAEDVYASATPSLDQFGTDAFLYEGSSPWQMQGQYYENWTKAIEIGRDGLPTYPEMMMVQLPSWAPYEDWADAERIPLRPAKKIYIEVEVERPTLVDGKEVVTTSTEVMEHSIPGPCLRPLKRSIQTYDDQMRQLEKANPATFNVERRCLGPDTRVLTDDLRWVRIDDLRVGDGLVSLEEFGQKYEGAHHRRERTLQPAVVEAKIDSFDMAYRLEFHDGTSVVCSGKHRWLSGSAGSDASLRWRSIEPQSTYGPRSMMKVGDTIRAVVEPWDDDPSWDAGWLSGMYDGEGCITSRRRRRTEFRIDLTQNPGVVHDRAWQLLEDKGFCPRNASHHSRKAQTIKVTGLSQCMRLLGQLRPLRLLQNGNPHMWEGRALGHEVGRRFSKTITAIVPLSEQRLVDVQTSTGTFVAEGLASHNSHWAESIASYLDRDKIEEMFGPYQGVPLQIQTRGLLSTTYKAHGDPAKVNDNFGFAIGHTEKGVVESNYLPHVVFDVIHHWRPQDFDKNTIDYLIIQEHMERYLDAFMMDELTFDQWNSIMTIGSLNKYVQEKGFPKRISIFERTATRPLNWKRAEVFKAALNMGLLHAPMLAADGSISEHSEMAELELRFLEEKNGKVDHPDSGPIQHNDISDAMFEVVFSLIGEEMSTFLGQALGSAGVSGSSLGGTNPYAKMNPNNDTSAGLAAVTGAAARQRGLAQQKSVARGGLASRGLDGRGGMRRR